MRIAAALAVLHLVCGCTNLSYPEPEEAAAEGTASDGSGQIATAPDARAWVDFSARGREAMRLRDYAAAEEAYLSALAETAVFPLHDVRVRSALGNVVHLAGVRQSRGEWSDAERLLEHVVRHAERGRLADFGAAAPVLARQAAFALREGDETETIRLYETALALYGAQDAAVVEERLDLQARLGDAYLSAERPDEAEPLILAVRQTAQSLYGPESLAAARAYVAVGKLRAAQDDFEAAERAYLRAIAIAERAAPDSLPLAAHRAGLARVYLDHGRTEDAAALAAESLAGLETADPDATPTGVRVAVLDTLATAETRLGRTTEARRHFERALADFEELAPSEQRATVELLDHYAALERSTGRGAAAARLSARADEVRASAPPPDAATPSGSADAEADAGISEGVGS